MGIFHRAVAALALTAAAGCASDGSHMQYMNGERAAVDGIYREGNLIRVYATMSRSGSASEALASALRKAAEMTSARGFERFGVTKVSDCGTLVMNGSITVSHSCRLLARMVGPTEAAEPEGDRPVTYYRVGDVLSGNLRPEGQ